MLVCWVACPIFLVKTTDVCFMRHAKCQVSSCSELKVTHGQEFRSSYKHPLKQTVESKRWRHPGFIERSSDQDVQCLWPSGGMVLVRRVTDNVVVVSWLEAYIDMKKCCHWTPRSFRAEPLFGLRLLSLDAQIQTRGEFFGAYKSLWLMSTGLVTTWRLTRGAAPKIFAVFYDVMSKNRSLDVFFLLGLQSWKLRFNLSAFNHYRTGLMLRPQSNDAVVFFSTEKSRGWQDRCGHSTCRRQCTTDVQRLWGGMLMLISRHLQRYRRHCKDFAEFSCLPTWHGISLWICTLGQSQLRNWRSLNLISRRTNCPMLEPWFLLSITGHHFHLRWGLKTSRGA